MPPAPVDLMPAQPTGLEIRRARIMSVVGRLPEGHLDLVESLLESLANLRDVGVLLEVDVKQRGDGPHVGRPDSR